MKHIHTFLELSKQTCCNAIHDFQTKSFLWENKKPYTGIEPNELSHRGTRLMYNQFEEAHCYTNNYIGRGMPVMRFTQGTVLKYKSDYFIIAPLGVDFSKAFFCANLKSVIKIWKFSMYSSLLTL